MDVGYHFIRELVETEVIKLEYVHTKENIAEALTKNLPSEQHEKLLLPLFSE